MNDNEIRRIVTTSTTPCSVGPSVKQWAYSRQPFAMTGVHVQVRVERDMTTVEAVDAATGTLIASGDNIVTLSGRMGLKRAA